MIGLEESEVRDELQRKIIGIAGVKSITFNKKSGQVIVDCCEVKGESLKPVITASIELELCMAMRRRSLIQNPVEVRESTITVPFVYSYIRTRKNRVLWMTSWTAKKRVMRH